MSEEMKVKLNFYDKLFESYRKEIECLWQRSIFLGTFLVLIFTGYGSLFKLWFEKCSEDCVFKMFFCKFGSNDYSVLNIVMMVVCFLGVVFSVLWILMAKGSKDWQEAYEIKIRLFEETLGIENIISKDYGKTTSCKDTFYKKYGIEPKLLSWVDIENQKNPSIFALKSGGYSTSKVNICIGVVCYIFWAVIFCFHFVKLWQGCKETEFMYCVVPLVVTAVIIAGITELLKKVNKGTL